MGENESSRSGATNTLPALTTRAANDSDDMAESESTKSPAFQFYPSDFLSDVNVVAMSLQERGAYITLLCFCWIQGSLPRDVARLARLCGVPLATFRKIWPALETCFRDAELTDRLRHPRLDRERVKQAAYRQQQSERGRLGGRPRKAAEKPSLSETQSQTKAWTNPDESSSSSVFSLQTSVPHPQRAEGVVRTRGTSAGVMAGTLQRDHLRHSWCGERLCVPEFLHGEFVRSLATPDADADLKAFYAEREAQLQGPVAVDPAKFWRREVAARWPAPESGDAALTVKLRHASNEFIRS